MSDRARYRVSTTFGVTTEKKKEVTETAFSLCSLPTVILSSITSFLEEKCAYSFLGVNCLCWFTVRGLSSSSPHRAEIKIQNDLDRWLHNRWKPKHLIFPETNILPLPPGNPRFRFFLQEVVTLDCPTNWFHAVLGADLENEEKKKQETKKEKGDNKNNNNDEAVIEEVTTDEAISDLFPHLRHLRTVYANYTPRQLQALAKRFPLLESFALGGAFWRDPTNKVQWFNLRYLEMEKSDVLPPALAFTPRLRSLVIRESHHNRLEVYPQPNDLCPIQPSLHSCKLTSLHLHRIAHLSEYFIYLHSLPRGLVDLSLEVNFFEFDYGMRYVANHFLSSFAWPSGLLSLRFICKGLSQEFQQEQKSHHFIPLSFFLGLSLPLTLSSLSIHGMVQEPSVINAAMDLLNLDTYIYNKMSGRWRQNLTNNIASIHRLRTFRALEKQNVSKTGADT